MAGVEIVSDLSTRLEGIFPSLGVIISFLGLLVTLFIFVKQQRRLERLQKQETYQRLELASNELFRFTANNAAVLVGFGTMEKDAALEVSEVECMVADNHIFQTLNLFEMAARLRQANVFEDEVFGSWVVWYHDLLGSWYFRESWPDMRPNYTAEVRRVFDEPVRDFDSRMDDGLRRRQFFAHVAKVLNCPRVKNWLDE